MHGDWGGKTKFAVQAGQPRAEQGGGAAFVARIRGKSGDGVVRRGAQGFGLGQSMPLHYPTRDFDLRRHKNVSNKTDTALLQLPLPFTIALSLPAYYSLPPKSCGPSLYF